MSGATRRDRACAASGRPCGRRRARDLDEAIEELCQIADWTNDIFAEAAGVTAGSW